MFKKQLKKLYVLGPKGTNSEMAANKYIKEHGLSAKIILCKTLEQGVLEVLKDKNAALLGCIAYPELHNLIFPYLELLQIGEVFLCDTYEMVLAKKKNSITINKVASHKAPSSLVEEQYPIILCNSNADARLCSQNKTDACITTREAADKFNLEVIKSYDSLPMGFSIHVHKKILVNS